MHFGCLRASLLVLTVFLAACRACGSSPSEATDEERIERTTPRPRAAAPAQINDAVPSIPRHLLPPEINSSFGLTCLHSETASPPPNRCEAWNQNLNSCLASLEKALVERPVSRNEQRRHAWDAAMLTATLLLHNGREREAIQQYQKAREAAAPLGSAFEQLTLRELSIAQLRWGERQNCIENHNAETCLLPIRRGGVHADPEGSRTAAKTLKALLEMDPGDENMAWLLNLAYMTLGEHPQGVPAPYRMDTHLFTSAVDYPRFENVAPRLGLNREGLVGGVILDDFNNNGYLDIVVSSIGFCDPIRYYENDGTGTFTERTEEAGLAQVLGVGHMIQADFDNDGHLDIYATRGMWERPGQPTELGMPVHNTLLRNRGDGTFEDVTLEAGLSKTPHYNVASVWMDYNRNGFVDLFVCGGGNSASYLYRNENGRFEDVTQASGIDNESTCLGAAWGDVNNNGWPDLFLANHRAPNQLYLNQGDGTFAKASAPLLEETPEHAFATWFWDYDNDGHLDLFVAAWDASLDQVAASLRKEVTGAETVRIFRNNGDGTFSDKTVGMGLDSAILVMGANFGDLDNNGYLDIYLGTGAPDLAALMPNRMYRNDAGKRFVDITYAGGFGNIQKGHGIAFGDLTNNGYPDVFASMGGWILADRFADSLYANPGGDHGWLLLRLQGTEANRSAIGSRVVAHILENGKPRSIHRVVGSGGSFGSNSLQVQLGLGKATQVERLEIHWAGGEASTFHHVHPNQILAIRQGDDSYEVVDAPSFSFPAESSPHEHHH